MHIGKMNKRITLLKPVTTEDAYGGFSTEYTEVGKLWAQLITTNYDQQQALGTPMSREQLRLKIRPNKSIKRGWRILLDGQTYDVQDIYDTYKDNAQLIVHRYESGV